MKKVAVLRYFFNVACFTTAFGMTFWWFYRFFKNEDSVQIDEKPLNFHDGHYPILSFCLNDPFIDSKLKKYNDTLTIAEYKMILMGLSSYKGIENINFDDVTLDLADFYLGFDVHFRNGTTIEKMYHDALEFLPQVTYSGLSFGSFRKCFGFDSMLTNIHVVTLKFNSSIYPEGIRPSSFSMPFSPIIAIHLPNQIFILGSMVKYTWPMRSQKNAYRMDLTLQQIDILKRRNKRNDHCISEDYNFDQNFLDDHLGMVGCKAPYHRTNKNFELCGLQKKMEEASFDLGTTEIQMKACTSISSLTFTYDESDIHGYGLDFFQLALKYPKQYRVTKMIRAIDIQTLIGNAGGYIGLFLGKLIQVSLKLMDGL